MLRFLINISGIFPPVPYRFNLSMNDNIYKLVRRLNIPAFHKIFRTYFIASSAGILISGSIPILFILFPSAV